MASAEAGGSACRSCGAAIVWATTRNGKTMPIDAAPVGIGNGNVLLAENFDGKLTATVTAEGGGDHVSHFATCPNAEHRQ